MTMLPFGETEDSEALPVQVKRFHRRFASGVTIVTTTVEGQYRGLTVNAFASISLEPPLVLIAVNRDAATHEFLYRTDVVAVNIAAGDQIGLVKRFASPIPDKFDGVAWQPGSYGCPLLEGSCACLEGRVVSRLQAFTHTVFIVEVHDIRLSDKAPLIYCGARFFSGSIFDGTVNCDDPAA